MKFAILALAACSLVGCSSTAATTDDKVAWRWRLDHLDASDFGGPGATPATTGDFSFPFDERSFFEETLDHVDGVSELDLLVWMKENMREVKIEKRGQKDCVLSTKVGVKEPSGLRVTTPLDGECIAVELPAIFHYVDPKDGLRHPSYGRFRLTYARER